MERRQAVIALVLVALICLGGCVGTIGEPPTSDAAPSEGDASDEPAQPELDDSSAYPETETTADSDDALPVDVLRAYDRLAALVESDADAPRLELEDMDELLEDVYDSRQDPFHEAMNLTEVEIDTENARGIAYGDDHVVVDPNEGDEADIEQVVVHEFFHAIQSAEGWYPDTDGIDLETQTSTDFEQVHLALVEGGAVWVTDRYSMDYQDDDVRLQSERLADEYETAPDGDRFFRAPYHYGTDYVDDRVDDPADVGEVYENPPETTEQLLHGLDPEEAPPAGLEVETVEGDDWRVDRNDRLGELFVRVALSSELDYDLAVDAAAGWGDDRLVDFDRVDGDDDGFVWVTTWDDETEADEFEAAFGALLEERSDDAADDTELERHDDRTVLVTVGPDAFHDAVSVTGEDTDFEVAIDD